MKMGRVFILIILFLSMFMLLRFFEKGLVNEEALPTLSLGFVLVSAFLFGKTVKDYSLPMVTGYLILGILSGPYVMNLISHETTQALRLIDEIALSLIALTAGGELRMKEMRNLWKPLFYISLVLTGVVTAGIAIFTFLFLYLKPLPGAEGLLVNLFIGLILGIWAVNSSPDITIGVITEYRAKGKLTETILGVTILKDILVIALFTILLSFGQNLFTPERGSEPVFPLLARKILGSFLAGTGFGWLMAMYLKRVGKEVTLFLVGSALFITSFSHSYGLEPILVAVAAGFFVENFSEEGESFIKAVERGSLPIYAIFFAIAGASLDIEGFRRMWLIGAVFAALRVLTIYVGSRFGASLAEAEKEIGHYTWLGLISQAGVTLGLAIMVERRFPLWGMGFKELALAIIVFNLLLGPFTLQYALKRAGEIEGGQPSR